MPSSFSCLPCSVQEQEEQDDEQSACGIMSFFRRLFGSSQS